MGVRREVLPVIVLPDIFFIIFMRLLRVIRHDHSRATNAQRPVLLCGLHIRRVHVHWHGHCRVDDAGVWKVRRSGVVAALGHIQCTGRGIPSLRQVHLVGRTQSG